VKIGVDVAVKGGVEVIEPPGVNVDVGVPVVVEVEVGVCVVSATGGIVGVLVGRGQEKLCTNRTYNAQPPLGSTSFTTTEKTSPAGTLNEYDLEVSGLLPISAR
jgi:hypothetical protein